MRLIPVFALGAAPLLAGCHSAVIDATLINTSDQAIQLIEVDYPSASFGTQSLLPNQSFHYRFKVLGSGATKLTWTDSRRQEHTAAGPVLNEGAEGKLTITVSGNDSVAWSPALQTAR